jgi:PIN domain nuclease of toxin-antitoxin system
VPQSQRPDERAQLLVGLKPLSIEAVHIERAVNLPWHHRDPFDRLLIGQALEEDLALIGGDSRFDSYGCRRIWK